MNKRIKKIEKELAENTKKGDIKVGDFVNTSKASASASTSATATATAKQENDIYFYSLSKHLKCGTRQKRNGKQEPSMPVNITAKGDDEEIECEWMDGTRKILAGVLVSMVKEDMKDSSINRRGSKKDNPALWEGDHEHSRHHLKLAQLMDRSLLLDAYDQDLKICSFRINRHGPLPYPQPAVVPEDNLTLISCLKFAVPLMPKF